MKSEIDYRYSIYAVLIYYKILSNYRSVQSLDCKTGPLIH